GVVVGGLRERLHLDLGLGVGGVVVRDDLVDDGELFLVPRVVGPHGELAALAGPTPTARGLAATTSEYQHRDQRGYTCTCEGPWPTPSHDRFLRSTAR